jgi:hypothetical protein
MIRLVHHLQERYKFRQEMLESFSLQETGPGPELDQFLTSLQMGFYVDEGVDSGFFGLRMKGALYFPKVRNSGSVGSMDDAIQSLYIDDRKQKVSHWPPTWDDDILLQDPLLEHARVFDEFVRPAATTTQEQIRLHLRRVYWFGLMAPESDLLAGISITNGFPRLVFEILHWRATRNLPQWRAEYVPMYTDDKEMEIAIPEVKVDQNYSQWVARYTDWMVEAGKALERDRKIKPAERALLFVPNALGYYEDLYAGYEKEHFGRVRDFVLRYANGRGEGVINAVRESIPGSAGKILSGELAPLLIQGETELQIGGWTSAWRRRMQTRGQAQ